MKNIKEKYSGWALITGASSGIGEEFALQLAAKGMNLILVARRLQRLQKLKEELERKYQIEVLAVQLDLLLPNFLDELKEKVNNRHVAMLINNAGFGYRGEFINSDPKKESEMIILNCVAPTILTHHFVQPMVTRKNGAIIFLGSIVAFQSTPTTTTYAATKAFNLIMGESLWYELRKYNIDVLSINPGGTSTEFQAIAGSTTGPIPRTVKQVVKTALRALGRKPSVVDGLFNKVVVIISKFLPRKVAAVLAGKISESLFMGN
jgi:uncharacterized protein